MKGEIYSTFGRNYINSNASELGSYHKKKESPLKPELTVPGPKSLHSFSDMRTGEIKGEVGSRILDHLSSLSKVDTTRHIVQSSVRALTNELLYAAFNDTPDKEIMLLPVMRAGLPMWEAANNFFHYPESAFAWGSKEKGSDRADIELQKKNNAVNKHIIVLDTIIATGDTLAQLSSEIEETYRDAESITVVSCYASPTGLQRASEAMNNANFVVGCIAESVDDRGFLVPPTNGDLGDKLYGKTQTL